MAVGSFIELHFSGPTISNVMKGHVLASGSETTINEGVPLSSRDPSHCLTCQAPLFRYKRI